MLKIGTDRIRGQYIEGGKGKSHTTDAQWKVVGYTITLVLKVVRKTEALKTLDISFNLHNISLILPRIVPGYIQHSTTNLTIDPNMLSLVHAKQTVGDYKELFGVILSKTSMTSLSIQMMGLIPTLVGSLVAVARSVKSRH